MAAKLSSFSVMVSMADICRHGEDRDQWLGMAVCHLSSESAHPGALWLIISVTHRQHWDQGQSLLRPVRRTQAIVWGYLEWFFPPSRQDWMRTPG